MYDEKHVVFVVVREVLTRNRIGIHLWMCIVQVNPSSQCSADMKLGQQTKNDADAQLDASLTNLSWLQTLNCQSGLTKALQTPTHPPQTGIRFLRRREFTAPPEMKVPMQRLNCSKFSIESPPTIDQLEQALRQQNEIPPNIDWSKCKSPKPPHNYVSDVIHRTIGNRGVMCTF